MFTAYLRERLIVSLRPTGVDEREDDPKGPELLEVEFEVRLKFPREVEGDELAFPICWLSGIGVFVGEGVAELFPTSPSMFCKCTSQSSLGGRSVVIVGDNLEFNMNLLLCLDYPIRV